MSALAIDPERAQLELLARARRRVQEIEQEERATELDARICDPIVSLGEDPFAAEVRKRWLDNCHQRGPMYWARNHTRTEDRQWLAKLMAADKEEYLRITRGGASAISKATPRNPMPYRPHPGQRWDYLDCAMLFLLTQPTLFLPKTREMLTSWLVVLYITWLCQTFPSVEYISQSEKDDKAQELIVYSTILYDNQPKWLRERHPLKGKTTEMIEWANGSRFIALPKGVRQIASYHPFGYFQDEAAHLPEAEQAFNVARPVARQIVAVSSVAPGWFWNECA